MRPTRPAATTTSRQWWQIGGRDPYPRSGPPSSLGCRMPRRPSPAAQRGRASGRNELALNAVGIGDGAGEDENNGNAFMRIRYSFKGNEQVFEEDKALAIVGRRTADAAPDLDLSPDYSVSRSHARISIEEGSAWIEDLGSRIGTFLGETDIRGMGRQPWRTRDAVRIGA